MNAEDRPHHAPGTHPDTHESDYDYGRFRQDQLVDAHASFEPMLQRFFRAGWDAHREEMRQQAMAQGWRE